MSDPAPGRKALTKVIQHLMFEHSAEGSGRVRAELDAAGLPVIRIASQAFPGTAPDPGDLLKALAGPVKTVVVDLRECSYLSSTDLGLIAGLAASQQEYGWRICVVGASRQAQKMFELVGLTTAFDLCATMGEIEGR